MSQRTTRTPGALYSEPRTSASRRRCSGHLTAVHFIERGDLAVWSALPPGGELGYTTWQHAVFCLACAPALKGPGDPDA